MANLLSTIVSGRLSIGSSTATPYLTTAPDGIVFGGNEVGNAYRLYTDLENIGGNYTKLNIAWHTGIKIGAHVNYGGTRFYNDFPASGTEIFSVGKGDSHVRVVNNLYVGGNLALHAGNYNSYSPTLTGTGASGTWGISITGNAATATTAYSLSNNGGLTTQFGNATVGYAYALNATTAGLFAAPDNSNSILTVNRHPGDYYSQLGFSSNGNLYYRRFSAAAINTSEAWQTIWTSSSLTNLNQLSNGPGYITSVGNITRLWAESHPNDYYVRANWTGSYWQLTSNHPSPVQVGYADNAGAVAWDNVSSKPSLDYQQNYTLTAPASTDGSGYSWVRITMGGFNAGGDFVRFSIARAIGWNGASPYGGPSMDVVAYSREWHGGQEGAVITYAQHGSVPGNGWVTNAGPRDLAGGGYWFYMRIWGGVDYAMRVYRGSGQIGTSWESTSDPTNVFALRVGVNNIGSTDTGFNTTGPIYGSTLYNGANAVIHAGNIGSQSVTYSTTAGALTSMNISQFTNNSGYITSAVPYGDMTSSTGLNDNKLYLRTNGDNNHYIWNAADDWEEIVAYSGTGLRIASSTGVTLATFTTSGLSVNGTATVTGGGSYPVMTTSLQRYMMQIRNTNNSVNASYGWWWFMDTNFNMGFHADGAADRFTLTRDGNLTVTGTLSASNFSGSSSGTNTGDQTNISGNSATTSQIVFSDLKINFPSGAGGGHNFGSNHYSMGLDSGNGAWSDPHYRDVIIGYHTGIRLGASYSGIRFYNNSPTTDANNDGNGDGGEGLLMTVGGYVGTANHTDVVVNNNLFANVSMRAPIFYDSANTAYYGDFAGISSMYGVAIRGDLSSTDTSNQIFFWGAGNSTTSAIGFKANGGNFTNPTGAGDGYNTYFTMDSPGRGWVFREGTGGTNFAAAYTSGWILNTGVWQANASMRAPIFYDSQDTAYYVDPNSTSNLSNVSVVGYQYIGGQTSNGQSNYQWDGADYRNPGDWTARLILRKDNATTGINGSIPSLVIFNNNGADQTTASMVFATNECVTGSNSVNLAGIIAKKESAGNCGGWSAGSLNFFVKNYGARVDSLALTPDGNATFSGIVYSTGYGNSIQWNTAYGWGNHASAGYQVASTAITTSNIGNQSVSNATTAGGLAVHGGTNNEANKIVRTDANGYIQAGWINSISGNMGFENRIARITCSTDQYMRYQTLTEFKVSMGLSGKNEYSRRIDYTSDANYHVGSFGHAGTSTNDVWHYGSGFYDVWAGGGTFPGSMTHIHGFNAVHYSAGAGGNGYGWQMASQYNRPGEYYARNIDGGTFSSWRQFITSDNIGSQSVSNAATVGGYSVSVAGTSNTIPTRNANGYLIPENWIQLNGAYGLYSPTNSAHLRPNPNSYGPWLVTGTRNGWSGIEFDVNNGNVSLMVNPSSNTTGFHNNAYGWQFFWESGTLYCFKNTYGAGTQATVLDSSNFTTYAQEKENQRLSTTNDVTHNSTTSPTFLVNGHSDNTKGYRIHNTSGSSVSAMFTNSSNQLVIAAGAFDQINLNKKVLVNAVALGVNIAPSATAGRIDASNDIVAYSSSDERLKQNITPIANALDKVKSLTGVEFDWKPEHKEAHGHEGHDTGIIAQQVLAVMPTAVRTNDTGYLAVRYEKLIGLLIEANKELAARVEELEKKIG